jgi:hypothetical protein
MRVVAKSYSPMKARLFRSSIAAFLLFTCSTISFSAEHESICHEISFHGSVRAGKHFSRQIGSGLQLRLLPVQFSDPSTATPLNGWWVQLVPLSQPDQCGRGKTAFIPSIFRSASTLGKTLAQATE